MATPQEGGEDEQATRPFAGIREIVVERYRKMKEDAETYPYVWGSYIVVYGGFALWFAYRWRKLRRTEDRVRALQARLHNLVEDEERASSAQSAQKAPPSSDKTKTSQ